MSIRSLPVLLAIVCTLFPFRGVTQPTSPLAYPSYDYGEYQPAFSKRQDTAFTIVTGVQTDSGPNGSVPLRLEVRELEKDPVAWTLYILGLDMMQHTPQADKLSWYQIAGIHGRPFVPFDNVQAKPGDDQNGYCHHVSILFPTWHRPYLALFEQVLHEYVQRIANQYPAGSVRDQYVAAAANFRIPYWDWAAVPSDDSSIYPQSVGGSASISVDGPAGLQTIANPLYSYRFQPLDPAQLPNPPFDRFNQTLRYPSVDEMPVMSQNSLVAQQLDNSAASFRDRLYILLTMYHDYTTFSNEAWITTDNPENYDSLESIHDQIHGLTGSGGHMTYINYSAFDPLFWLHHAMVDRIFAMWQSINPDSYVVPEPAIFNTFTTSLGDTQDVNTPLTPFRKDATGAFWTSDTVRTTEIFGYAYPETAKYTNVNVRNQVIAATNKLYGPSIDTKSKTPRSESSSTINRAQKWIANIRVNKYALGVPFYIHIFVGPFNLSPFSWSFDPNLVATHYVSVKPISSSPTSPIDSSPNQLVTATIPLTVRLEQDIRNGLLQSLSPVDVTPYLASKLGYRVSLLNDTEVSNADIPSLKVSIFDLGLERSDSEEELPRWGRMRGHLDVSFGL